MKFTLEKHRFFPFVAWGLIIGFVFFTYSLALHLAEPSGTLNEKTEATVSALEES